MNKVLLLLLVTLVQSQSDGILLPDPRNSDKSDNNLEDIQIEDWDNSDSIYSPDLDKDYSQKYQSPRKRFAADLLTRRSSLDKNFMRFGRGFSESVPQKSIQVESTPYSENGPDFERPGRGLKDNFIRFGRGAQDNFIRFGRGAQDNFIRFGRGAQDNFIRFGRGSKDSFIRFGRMSPDFFRSGKSERVNFIRFGKADKNFMRFGREKTAGSEEKPENLDNQNYLDRLKEAMNENEEGGGSFERFIKAFGPPDNFIRFGKSGNQKEKRNGTNFLRFGKSDPAESSELTGDLDAESTTIQDSYPAIMRVKRKATNSGNSVKANGDKTPGKKAKTVTSRTDKSTAKPATDSGEHPTGKGVEKRSTGYFEEIPEGFSRRVSPVYGTNTWQSFDKFGNLRWSQPYFPTFYNFPNNPYLPFANKQSKRDQEAGGGGGRGGSNFIRFG